MINMLRCSQCDPPVEFTMKWSLKRHIASKHVKQEVEKYMCSICQQTFRRKDNYQRHMYKHTTNDKNDTTFVCWSCGQQFVRKDIMLRHVQNIHVIKKDELHECSICRQSFCRLDNYRRHITRKHKTNDLNFKCDKCERKFSKLQYLRIHVKYIHNKTSRREKTCKSLATNTCLFCSTFFDCNSDLFAHYKEIHDLKIDTETLQFKNTIEFDMWKKELEKCTQTVYYKREFNDKQFGQTLSYVCEYSDLQEPVHSNTRSTRKKRLNNIDLRCPSEIKLSIDKDDVCEVEFIKTHVGHETDGQYLAHVSCSKILNDVTASFSGLGKDIEKINLLTRNDFCNIKSSITYSEQVSDNGENIFDVDDQCMDDFDTSELILADASDTVNGITITKMESNLKNSSLNVGSYVEDNIESILYYKGTDELDAEHPELNENDFVLIIMNDGQESMLKKSGNDVITMDGTHLGEFNITLHSLIVLDSVRRGFPCCFMFCNHNKEVLINIMLTCVRNRIGTLKPKVFMSSIQHTYYDSWISVMEVPKYRLFCSWNVKNTWRKHFCKIPCPEKRETVKKILFDLLEETKADVFEKNLKKFLANKDNDLVEFKRYFRKHFLNNKNCWAYCYRIHAGVNTNKHVNFVYMLIKRAFSEKPENFRDALERLDFYMQDKGRKLVITQVKGKLSPKLGHIRKRHEMAARLSTSGIRACDDGWLVPSFRNLKKKKQTYKVKRIKNKCHDCRLICDKCNSCLHQYECNCVDSAIKNNMCVHIHVLCRTLVNYEVMFTPLNTNEISTLNLLKLDKSSGNVAAKLKSLKSSRSIGFCEGKINEESPVSPMSDDSWTPYEICEIEQVDSNDSTASSVIVETIKASAINSPVIISDTENQDNESSHFQNRLQNCKEKLLKVLRQVSTTKELNILEETVSRLESS